MDLHEQLKYFNQERQQQQFKPKAKMNDYTNIISPTTTTTNSTSRKQVNVKLAQALDSNRTNQDETYQDPLNTILSNELFAQIQRKICNFACIYAIIIICLYVTYALYLFYYQQQSQLIDHNRASTHAREAQEAQLLNGGSVVKSSQLISGGDYAAPEQQLAFIDMTTKLESKIHLLERYIELVAVDLQETKNRLKEREKCDCSISCTFNNTTYSDGSRWQSQCDICTCKFGKISCVPQKCPETKCDVAITLPGQCCPTCMKSCKYNNSTIQHGQKFSPQTINYPLNYKTNSTTTQNRVKECKCNDGLIKCEQKLKKTSPTSNGQSIDNNNNNKRTLTQEEATLTGLKRDRNKITTTTTTTENTQNSSIGGKRKENEIVDLSESLSRKSI